MTVEAAQLRSGKGSGDENFPVASWLIQPRHRAPILAFYEFVRVADDVADHPRLPPGEKLAHLDRLEASLTGNSDSEAVGATLRTVLRERNLSPQHALDLLKAFRRDVTKLRYANWQELIDYCSYSAMPVGRFVLDVHGEGRFVWPANDALCAALQIINHLQDCQKDYRQLDRVYIPLDALEAARSNVTALDADRASPELRQCLHGLAERTGALLDDGGELHRLVNDRRLAMEIAAIETLARRLVEMLKHRDPLSETVHLGKLSMAGAAATGAMRCMFDRLFRSTPPVYPVRAND